MEVLGQILSSMIFFFILLRHCLNLYHKRKLPPGPIGLPIIGNLLSLGPKPHESLAKLADKHGPFMTIRLGSLTTVVASTPDAARDILQHNDEACSGRLVPHAATGMAHPNEAILFMSPNETWRTIRKALNMYLMNQKKLETLTDLRQTVVDGMLDFLRESRGPVDIGKTGFAVVLNQLSNTLFSQNVTNYNSDDVGRFKMAVETITKLHGKFNVADLFPVLRPLDPMSIRRHVKVAYDWLDQLLDSFVNTRLKHRELKLLRHDDMLDSLLDYSQDNEHKFNRKHIMALLEDLFVAGTDSVTTTITWTMTELLLNPNIFSKVREEVGKTVGEDGKINETRVLELPYLNAVIKEAMRLHLAVPLLVPHQTVKEVKLGKYIVPANTQILVNAWVLARDPKYWENPTVFMPERFLGNKLDYFGQHFQFIPFGSGRKSCPGIPLAHRMLNLIIASFVYHFDWELPYAKEEMDMKESFGLTLVKATSLVATPIPVK